MPTNTEIFALEDVHGGYRKVNGWYDALKNISFSISQGEKIAIVGANGSGKSSLLRLLTRECKIFGGEIRLLGRPMQTIPNRDYLKLGIFLGLQERTLFEELTILENAKILGVNAATIKHLPMSVDSPVSRLSGGQKKLLSICLAIDENNSFLFLDEPFAGMDENTAASALARIENLHRGSSRTTIIIEHRLDLAYQFADRFLGVHKGELVFDLIKNELGNVEQLKNSL